MRHHAWLMFFVTALGLAALTVDAQWLHQPMAGAPRTRDGKVNMTGPVPRLDGKPDLSGIWQVPGEPRAPGGLFGLGESLNSKYFRDVLSDFPPDQRPLTAEGAERLRRNGQPGVFNPVLNCLPDGIPHGDLLPEPFKILHSRGVIVMLYEVETTFRQIFMDGRKLPIDPAPAWQGYSVGRWQGDTLVIDTIGFNDVSWLDARGTPRSTEMRIEERIRRRDFGHLELTITMTDPRTFTKPITIRVVAELMPDTDLLEHYCLENERDDRRMPGRARP
ncbi:MAG TPA: hypothetical protein VGQ37_05495 [Vicinamibacterales bacterium]|jgi:hypothetical protein|nr:hypothetical protein [Vicinamibacterales bacterium]